MAVASGASAATTADPLADMLKRLQLDGHLAAFLEEELDLELLQSMEQQVLENNLAELGMNPAEVARMSAEVRL